MSAIDPISEAAIAAQRQDDLLRSEAEFVAQVFTQALNAFALREEAIGPSLVSTEVQLTRIARSAALLATVVGHMRTMPEDLHPLAEQLVALYQSKIQFEQPKARSVIEIAKRIPRAVRR